MNKMKDMSGIPTDSEATQNESAQEADADADANANANASSCPVTESSPLEANNTELPTPDAYMNQLNDMLKATGMGGFDFSKIMGNMPSGNNITPPD